MGPLAEVRAGPSRLGLPGGAGSGAEGRTLCPWTAAQPVTGSRACSVFFLRVLPAEGTWEGFCAGRSSTSTSSAKDFFKYYLPERGKWWADGGKTGAGVFQYHFQTVSVAWERPGSAISYCAAVKWRDSPSPASPAPFPGKMPEHNPPKHQPTLHLQQFPLQDLPGILSQGGRQKQTHSGE